jgi:predicted peptidase
MKSSEYLLDEIAGLRFLLSLPPRQPPERHPVLCFLHGLGEGAPVDILAGVTRHGPLRPGNPPLVLNDFIVVAPQLPARGDFWRFYRKAVIEIVEVIHARHKGDPLRTYLTGFSFGGNGVFELALRDPFAWRALWPVDPTRVPKRDPGLPVWLSSGEASRTRSDRFIEKLGLRPPGIDPGDRIYTDEGLDHVGTATSAYQNEKIYQWLLAMGEIS